MNDFIIVLSINISVVKRYEKVIFDHIGFEVRNVQIYGIKIGITFIKKLAIK